jgi:hypothetical protein
VAIQRYTTNLTGAQTGNAWVGFQNRSQKPLTELRLLEDPSARESELSSYGDRASIEMLRRTSASAAQFTLLSLLEKDLASNFNPGVSRVNAVLQVLGYVVLLGFWPVALMEVLLTQLSGASTQFMHSPEFAGINGLFLLVWGWLVKQTFTMLWPLVRHTPVLGVTAVKTGALSPKLIPQASLGRLFDQYASSGGTRMDRDGYHRFLAGIGYGDQHDVSVQGGFGSAYFRAHGCDDGMW